MSSITHPESHATKAENYASAVSGTQVLIERDETPVMFKRVADESNAISASVRQYPPTSPAIRNFGKIRACV
jgi:hypothetical protein